MPGNSVTRLKERLYRGQIDGTTLFRSLITDRLKPDARVLDLGCGRGKEQTDFRSEAAFVVGCDITDDVSENRFVTVRVRGDAHLLPFRQESFDIVVMDYVIEHLGYPASCASEIFRVLKKGGYFIFRTPNVYHYVSAIGYLTPHWFHQFMANRVRGLTGPHEPEVFKTYYRANTRRAAARVFAGAGFRPQQIIMVEREPSYLMFARFPLLLGYCYERLVNRYEFLRDFRSNIFGVVQKPL